MPTLRTSKAAHSYWSLSKLAAGLTVACLLAHTASATERLTPIVRAVRDASPSVVNIQGQKSVSETPEGSPTSPHQVNGMGTGIVIDPRGYILTNHHVVDGVRRINVTLSSGQTYVARLVAHDRQTDLAIIRINPSSKLQVVQIGTSGDLMPGETVIAVGNAYGYENTVTTGIVSALHRNVQVNETQQYLDLIQTDASINPGNSGGPLLNVDGEMIGVNVAVRAGAQGIGFAIPVDKAMEIATRLMSIESLDNHWHGLTTLKLDGPAGPVTVARIENNSPAAYSGLKRGDRIERVGSLDVHHPIDIERALLGMQSGAQVPVFIERNNQRLELDLRIADRNSSPVKRQTFEVNDDAMQAAWETLGLRLKLEPSSTFRSLDVPYEGGMRVVSVRPNSSAEREGVLEGDILVRMHRWATKSEDDIRFIVDHADQLARSGKVKFYIVRGENTYFGDLSVASRDSNAVR